MEQWEVSKQVDLIYPDPPFNSNHNYGAPYKGAVDKKETRLQNVFKDIWTYNDEAQERTDRICKTAAHPTRKTIQGLRVFLEDSDTEMLVHLIYMADRLWKMKDLLKPTGIVYPHCAPSANYHLRIIMDAIFGGLPAACLNSWSTDSIFDHSASPTSKRNSALAEAGEGSAMRVPEICYRRRAIVQNSMNSSTRLQLQMTNHKLLAVG